MSHSSVNKGHPRFVELDGLRALAVLSVILFHCDITGFFNAGFFGVDMFFAISGFIITAMLVKEFRENGDFRFRAFYFRRLKRLLPPVVALLFLASLTFFISESAFDVFRADVAAALAYASNIWQIVEKQSYFDTTPHVLKHLWSLAVEEQFYFLWPPLAYFSLKRYGPKTTGVLALSLALASAAWMWFLYDLNADGADQNRIYLGTDTHAMGLLAGAALACFWNPWAERVERRLLRWTWRIAATFALAALGYLVHTMDPANPALYHGAFLLVPVLTGLVAYCTMNDHDFFVSRLLQTDLAQWLGSRSYSLYLVHWLVFIWMRLLGYEDFSEPLVLGAGLLATALLSECMYRLVEVPSIQFRPQRLDELRMAVCVVSYTAAAWAIFLMTMPAPSEPLPELVAAPTPEAAAPAPVVVAAQPAPASGSAAPVPDEPSGPDEIIDGGEDIFAIGDSVLLGAKVHLAKTIPGIRIDASVGRQASQGLKVVKEWRGKSGKASTILLHLGTNGYINEAQFRELLGELADRKSVIVINVHASRRWSAPNNEMIARLAPEFPNVKVIDWNGLSASRPDFFVKDGIHLTPKGMRALTAQIKTATGGAVIVPESDTMLASRNNTKEALTEQKAAAKETEAKEHGAASADKTHAPGAEAAGDKAEGASRHGEPRSEGKADEKDKAEASAKPAPAESGTEHARAHEGAPRMAPASTELPQLN